MSEVSLEEGVGPSEASMTTNTAAMYRHVVQGYLVAIGPHAYAFCRVLRGGVFL